VGAVLGLDGTEFKLAPGTCPDGAAVLGFDGSGLVCGAAGTGSTLAQSGREVLAGFLGERAGVSITFPSLFTSVPAVSLTAESTLGLKATNLRRRLPTVASFFGRSVWAMDADGASWGPPTELVGGISESGIALIDLGGKPAIAFQRVFSSIDEIAFARGENLIVHWTAAEP
jgi:hypothetical protein